MKTLVDFVSPYLKTSHNLTMELSELVLSAFLTIGFQLYLLIVQSATFNWDY